MVVISERLANAKPTRKLVQILIDCRARLADSIGQIADMAGGDRTASNTAQRAFKLIRLEMNTARPGPGCPRSDGQTASSGGARLQRVILLRPDRKGGGRRRTESHVVGRIAEKEAAPRRTGRQVDNRRLGRRRRGRLLSRKRRRAGGAVIRRTEKRLCGVDADRRNNASQSRSRRSIEHTATARRRSPYVQLCDWPIRICQ